MSAQWKYQPILKWKQGERIALRELTATQWQDVVPVLELPAVVAVPDAAGLKAELPSYCDGIAKHFIATFPDDQAIGIDTRFVSTGYSRQLRLASVVTKALAKKSGRFLLPVISESMVTANPTDLHLLGEFPELILRVQTPMVDATQVAALVDAVVAAGVKRKKLHLVVDQYSMVNEDANAGFAAVTPYLDAALACGCASTTIAGGSFPVNLMGMKSGVTDLPRVEWTIWKLLQASGNYPSVRYSDYAVTNPAPLPELDPKQVNPSVQIRYAASTFWRLFKAGGFKNGRPNQYHLLCQLLLGDAVYSGATFSFGDANYDKAANGPAGKNNGNPSSWRRDATSHHLVLTAAAL